MNQKRQIVINILPQEAGAWEAIALAMFFAAIAFSVSCIASCTTRDTEVRMAAKTIQAGH